MEQDRQEFYADVIIIGGIALVGILLVIVLVLYGAAIYNKLNKKKMVDDIINSTTRTNGIKTTKGKFKEDVTD